MGMYTELNLRCELKEDVPEDVMKVLRFLYDRSTDEPANLPDHPFFTDHSWDRIGIGGSYSFPETRSCILYDQFTQATYISSVSNLKNYNFEIQKFLHWVQPYIDAYAGDCIGWVWRKEYSSPSLLHYPIFNEIDVPKEVLADDTYWASLEFEQGFDL